MEVDTMQDVEVSGRTEDSGSSHYRRETSHHFPDFRESFHRSFGSFHYCHGSFGGSGGKLVHLWNVQCSTTYADASTTSTEDSMEAVELT